MSLDTSKLAADLARDHNIATEKLTERQTADAIKQAILAEDFTTLVLPDGEQRVIYIPFRQVQALKTRIFALEEQLRKANLPDNAFRFYNDTTL